MLSWGATHSEKHSVDESTGLAYPERTPTPGDSYKVSEDPREFAEWVMHKITQQYDPKSQGEFLKALLFEVTGYWTRKLNDVVAEANRIEEQLEIFVEASGVAFPDDPSQENE